MKKIMYVLFAGIIIISCKSKSSTEKSTKDTANTTVSGDTAKKAETMTRTLVFERYEEGDYPHLVFTDPAQKKVMISVIPPKTHFWVWNS
jgi:hypothetical protein